MRKINWWVLCGWLIGGAICLICWGIVIYFAIEILGKR
jgi:hypothetical protein